LNYVEKLWSLKYTLLLLVLFQVFDTLSTILAIGAGAEEANPVMRALLHNDAAGLVMAKWAVIVLVFFAVYLDPLETPYVRAALTIMNVVYAVVLSSNFAMYGLATGQWVLPAAFWALMLALAIVAVDDVFFPKRQVRSEQAGSARPPTPPG
jgi:hypothetical protein